MSKKQIINIPIFTFFTVYFSLLGFQTQAQNLDSLIAIITDRSVNNLIRFEALQDLHISSLDQDRQKLSLSLERIEKLRLQAIAENNQQLLGDVLLIQGRVTGSLEQILEKYEECYDVYESLKDTISMVYTLNMIALTYDKKEELRYKLRYLLKAIDIGGNDLNNSGLASAHANLGAEYLNSGENNKALYHLKEAQRFMLHIEDIGGKDISINLGTVCFMMSDIYIEFEEFEKANNYIDRAEDFFIKGNALESAIVSNSKRGNLYRAKKEYEKALEFFGIAIDAYYELGQKDNNFHNKMILSQANILREMDEYKRAIVFCDQVKTKNRLILKGKNECLYLCYKAIGNNQRALAYLEEFKEVENLIYMQTLEESHKQMGFHIEMLSDSVEHAQELRLTNEAHKEDVRAEEKTRNYIAVAGLLVLLVAGGIYNRLRYTRKAKNIIEQQKDIVEFQKAEVEKVHKEITDSIQYAKRIQSAILPPFKLFKEYLSNSFILYKPKDVVAGDFYWIENKSDTVFFAAADCTGHGVPGAMVSVICVNGLNRSVNEFGLTSPAKILDNTRKLVIKEFEKSEKEVSDGMDISLCALNTKTNTLNWAGANSPLWVMRKGAEEMEEIKADKQPIGKYGLQKPFTNHSLQLEQGDTIYVFSDGYPDQFGGEKGKKYKTANFKKTLVQLAKKPIEKQKVSLDQEFELWRRDLEQIDDVCVIGVRI